MYFLFGLHGVNALTDGTIPRYLCAYVEGTYAHLYTLNLFGPKKQYLDALSSALDVDAASSPACASSRPGFMNLKLLMQIDSTAPLRSTYMYMGHLMLSDGKKQLKKERETTKLWIMQRKVAPLSRHVPREWRSRGTTKQRDDGPAPSAPRIQYADS